MESISKSKTNVILDRSGIPQAQVEFSLLNRGPLTKSHRDMGSSSRSRTSCSTARDRIISNASWSARSMISKIRSLTVAAIFGSHSRNFASNLSTNISIRLFPSLYLLVKNSTNPQKRLSLKSLEGRHLFLIAGARHSRQFDRTTQGSFES